MAGKIRITSMESFTEQSGDLSLVHPDTTPRPVNFWTVPRWWGTKPRTIYEHCARVDNSATGESIYVASKTNFPVLLIEHDGTDYTFDSDQTREHVDRIWVTSDATLKTGDDYRCPLRRAAITKV